MAQLCGSVRTVDAVGYVNIDRCISGIMCPSARRQSREHAIPVNSVTYQSLEQYTLEETHGSLNTCCGHGVAFNLDSLVNHAQEILERNMDDKSNRQAKIQEDACSACG